MATSKVFVFSMLFALLFVRIASQKSCLEPEDAISSLRIELEQLKTKVSILESTIEKSNDELRAKGDDIKQMENIILEKSESIASLQNKVEALQKVSYEQKTRIDKTEQALRVAEEVMVKAELAANFMKSLKILVNFSQVQRDGQKCIEMLKTEWIPVMKDQWLTFLSSLSSHFESLTAKTIEAYHMTKNSLLSHTVKIQKAAVPFIQEAHKFAKPYINQIETVTKPYVDMVVFTLEPYSGKPVRAYRMFVTSAISYHKQATALLCLPVIFLCRLYSATFRKKAWKPRRISHSNNVRRRLIRPHNID